MLTHTLETLETIPLNSKKRRFASYNTIVRLNVNQLWEEYKHNLKKVRTQ